MDIVLSGRLKLLFGRPLDLIRSMRSAQLPILRGKLIHSSRMKNWLDDGGGNEMSASAQE